MDISGLKEKIEGEISRIGNIEDLKQVKVSLLGRKGVVADYLDKLKTLDKDQRRDAGKAINEIKTWADLKIGELEKHFNEIERQNRERASLIDITMPGTAPVFGKKHPITLTLEEIIRIFGSLGFAVAEGPDIEAEYYNFEALNIPSDHPARDMQDTFYIRPGVVLRTHTSPVQIRTMEAQLPPVKIIAPGCVYRCDNDISHTPMFHQVEGLMVDKNVRFSDLKGILSIFIHEMFGPDTPLRFRPSYFPFTEPSAEVDIGCVICRGAGCRVCKDTGWLEILGSGMVHPQVFRNVGYDQEEITGFAFGMG
ncbi:MAG TPA: phenylalanine--tRNA ligase subunit alpha, partial [Syntrophorhabdaceae bacterium]|nr:phenylalanine--tRNA ligase subunit alpha [Syntrophorhabdaceae bacterium]